jgi:hypothetical protein
MSETYRFDAAIQQLLQQLHAEPSDVGEKWRILCPYPDHHDTDPSFYFNRRIGAFKCFGCGRGGGLKKLAQDLGLTYQNEESTDLQRDEADPFYFIHQDMVAADDSDDRATFSGGRGEQCGDEVTPPPLLRPFPDGVSWRHLPSQLLQAVDAKLWFDDWTTGCEIDRVWFPVMMNQRLAGWFGRVKSRREHQQHLNCKKIPKYRNNKRQATHQLLFPFDYVYRHFRHRAVVLVEGQVDALTLIHAGIPALAIFGTKNWSEFKRTLLISAGFRQLIVAMDGDESGQQLQRTLVPQLKPDFKVVVDFTVPHGYDPDSMPTKYRARLHSLCH